MNLLCLYFNVICIFDDTVLNLDTLGEITFMMHTLCCVYEKESWKRAIAKTHRPSQ